MTLTYDYPQVTKDQILDHKNAEFINNHHKYKQNYQICSECYTDHTNNSTGFQKLIAEN
jgi:hypothetical protein